MMIYSPMDSLEQTPVKFNQNMVIFIQENAFDNVSKMVAFLLRPQSVNSQQILNSNRHPWWSIMGFDELMI